MDEKELKTVELPLTERELNILHDALITKINRVSKCIEIVAENPELVSALKKEIDTIQSLHTKVCKLMVG